MPTLSNKHANPQRSFYPGFNGGLNLSVPNESLPKNELKEALNVEFSPLTGSMKVRGGLVWSGRFNGRVIGIVPVNGREGFLVRTTSLWPEYFRWNNTWPIVGGFLEDNNNKSIVPWTDKDGKDSWIIADGNCLWKFSDSPIPSLRPMDGGMGIANIPLDCRIVFVRDGRVGVACTKKGGDDEEYERILFSAVGDCESNGCWNVDDDDESSAKQLEIGYKDGMKIDAVVPLSKDLIIFKSPPGEPDKGTIYRLTGSYPDWQVLEVAHNTGTFSQNSVCVIGNDIFYATVAGIATLSNVTAYGEVKTGWPDRKVSNALTPELNANARLFDVPVKQQLWVSPNENSKDIWVFDYAHGIWTKFEFPARITYAAGVDNSLFVFIGRDVYEVNDWYTHDDLNDGQGKREIAARMKLGTILSGMQTLIKVVFASFGLFPLCEAKLKLGKFVMDFVAAGGVDYIAEDMDIAYEDDDPLFPESGVLTSRRRCIVRDWAFTPEIEIKGGGCSVSTIGLEMAEV